MQPEANHNRLNLAHLLANGPTQKSDFTSRTYFLLAPNHFVQSPRDDAFDQAIPPDQPRPRSDEFIRYVPRSNEFIRHVPRSNKFIRYYVGLRRSTRTR